MFISTTDYHRKPLMFFSVEGEGEGGGGGQNESWRDSLPDELKGDASLADVPDVATLAKNYVETKAMVGGSFRVPGEDAGAEDWDKFHSRLMTSVPSLMFKPLADDAEGLEKVYDQMGRPAKADEYKIPEVDDKGLKLDMSLATDFKGIAHKYGLNQKQFNGIVEDLTGASIVKAEEARSVVDADVKKLLDEWGPVAYEPNLKLAIVGAEKTGAPDGIVGALKSGNPPYGLTKWLHQVATTLGDGEGNPLVTDTGTGQVLTPLDAKEQMSEMRRNADHPLNNPSYPGHGAALKKFSDLALLAHPEARV